MPELEMESARLAPAVLVLAIRARSHYGVAAGFLQPCRSANPD